MIFSIADLIIVGPMRMAAVALIAALLAGTSVPAQEITLQTVLERAAVYVATYQKQLQGIVAEEDYLQNMTRMRAAGPTASARIARDGRQLKSDVLLVKLG